jgi:hypothetical protein
MAVCQRCGDEARTLFETANQPNEVLASCSHVIVLSAWFYFWCFRVYRGYMPVYWSFIEMSPLQIPLLCKERLGEVESWHPREPTMGSAFECCEEATAPPYKGGELKDKQIYFLPMRMSEEPYFFTNR